jgi:FkbH-like protein
MKLLEALEILRMEPARDARPFTVYLVSGFNPLHIETFLSAMFCKRHPDQKLEIRGGLYGDFWGNLERAEKSSADSCVLLMEWADLDSRLGIRGLGSWAPKTLSDILKNARARGDQFLQTIRSISQKMPTVVSFPTLPLPPISFAQTWQGSSFDYELRTIVSSIGLEASRGSNVKVINPERLNWLSPHANRFDVKSELASGFPYKLPHASAVAELLIEAIQSRLPKKGLITDLDDTLWEGILGEIGVEGVSWDIDHHSHMHGVYQRMLHSLSETGVLIGVATKNSTELVEEALRRDDLLVPRGTFFPIEAHWGAKSQSVRRILDAWNIGADSILFIDDSPMELAEVKAAHPEVECILFPKDDPQAIQELLYRLRDLFGKAAISEEDSIRTGSIRQSQVRREQSENGDRTNEEFLRQSEAELTLSLSKNPLDPRALELVNKTNQFNLNGKRYTEASWQKYINHPDTVFVLASYRDKYGPLGKIAVLAGRKKHRKITLDVWVMSCRAFSRRIEYSCLQELFSRFDVDQIEFDFESNPKNSPIQEFLKEILQKPPAPHCELFRDQFAERSTETFQKVLEVTNG